MKLIGMLLLCGLLSGQDSAPAPKHRDIRVLDVSGTPRERGLTHGRAMKAEIREMLEPFRKDLEQTMGVDAKTFAARFLAKTDFMPAIEKHTPGLLDEVRGIAEGAELPFEEVYLWQLADEIWSMGKWSVRDKCTAIGVGPRGDQPAIVAQNLDVPVFYHAHPMVMRVRREGGPDTMVLTCPGLIGVNGMNAAGVAIACNTLLQLNRSPTGVPCLFVVRGVLEQKSLAEAQAWLEGIPHAVGQNYTIGDRTGVRALECSAGAKVRHEVKAGADFTYHTNTPYVNTDWHPELLARAEKQNREPAAMLKPCPRFEALGQALPPGDPITAASIKAALARKPVAHATTYACTLFILGKDPVLEISPGRPDKYAFQTIGF
jgi:predicted choloylglycine hydrolase